MITYNIKKLSSGDIVTLVTAEQSYEGDFEISNVMGWISRLLKIDLDDEYSIDISLRKYKSNGQTYVEFTMHDRYDNYIPKIFQDDIREMLEEEEDYDLLIELGKRDIL